jgi:chlorite dismutase
MPLPTVKLDRGIHAIHLFYNIDRSRWAAVPLEEREASRGRLEKLLGEFTAASHPICRAYLNVGGKSDLVFWAMAAELAELHAIHRKIEASFPAGTLQRVYSYLSVTELSEYMSTDDDNQQMLIQQEKLEPGSEKFNQRMGELRERMKQYEHYRLYPEMQDWEVMAFYAMSKRRSGNDNWYMLDFASRKKLMAGHARVGRKYAGRVSQLITGSTGLDDWEWGVTLVAHQLDAIKEIVYEMRFDEVSARYGEFGPFYINLRAQPADIWSSLGL